MRWLLAAAVATLALALRPDGCRTEEAETAATAAARTTADCTFTAQADVPDYLVLATLILRVDCATVKRGSPSPPSDARDGASFLIPFSTSRARTRRRASTGIDLFSYDNHPVASPGDQRYCASGRARRGRTLGPAGACESDPRL